MSTLHTSFKAFLCSPLPLMQGGLEKRHIHYEGRNLKMCTICMVQETHISDATDGQNKKSPNASSLCVCKPHRWLTPWGLSPVQHQRPQESARLCVETGPHGAPGDGTYSPGALHFERSAGAFENVCFPLQSLLSECWQILFKMPFDSLVSMCLLEPPLHP